MESVDVDAAWRMFVSSRNDIDSATQEVDDALEHATRVMERWLELQRLSNSANTMNFAHVSELMRHLEHALRIP